MATLFTVLLLSLSGAGDVAPQPTPLLAYQVMAPTNDEAPADEMAEEEIFEAPRKRMSYLAWTYRALGIRYALLLPASGLAVFIGACLVVMLSRRPAVIASYLVILPFPLMLGVFGTVECLISSLSFMSFSGDSVASRVDNITETVIIALVTTLVGFLVNAPAYFVIAIGLPLRTIMSTRGQSHESSRK